jgi:hypothetical protein
MNWESWRKHAGRRRGYIADACRIVQLIAPFRWWIVLAGLLNFATSGTSVGLIALAGCLIARAALVPKENRAALPPMDMGY